MKAKHLLIASVAGLLLGGLGTAASRADILYVSNNGSDSIAKFASDGVGSVFASGLASSSGLAFDSAGSLYAADVVFNRIVKLTGGVGAVFASTGLNQPYGMAFDSTGNLFAANSGNSTIEKFASGGVGSVFATTGLNRPQFLAFTDDVGVPLRLANQVPEPASAVLLLGGAALLGLRRRR